MSQQTISIPVGKISKKMCALLRIITTEQAISDAVFRYIDLKEEAVDWESVFALDLEPGCQTAIEFAYAVWTDQLRPGSPIFEKALAMSPELKKACLQALKIRWGV